MRSRPAHDPSVPTIIGRVLLLWLSLLVVAGVNAPLAYAQPAEAPATTGQPLQPTLPAPTGHDRIGVVPLHLVDRTRPDPWVP